VSLRAQGAEHGTGGKTQSAGYTLIELIAVLILVGIMSAAAGYAIFPMTEAYFVAMRSSEVAGKTQAALTRMVLELTNLADVSSGNSSSITFQSRDGSGAPGWHTLSWTGAGAPLTLDGATLLDAVQEMSLEYIRLDSGGNEIRTSVWSSGCRGMELSVTPSGSGGRPYAIKVFGRNVVP
jgi:prepilin-type N-terminal cleavage/methylation domain-containing protein